jgi:rhamnosyl/mannosyltransferase
MKIVHAYKDAYPPLIAGITRYIAMVAGTAAQRGHDVEICVAGVGHSRRDVLPDGVVVNRYAEHGRLLSNPLSPALVRAIRRIKADVIHLHMPNPLGELGAVQQETPIVSSFHSQLGRQRMLEPFYRPLQQRLLSRSTCVLVSSPRMLELPELQRHRDRTVVLPYGVDPDLVGPGPAERAPDTPIRLLFVGRLVYYKGIEVLLDAVSLLEGVELTIIGEGPLGPELSRRVMGEDTLRGRVIIRGGVSDTELAAAYRTHHVFVAPSVSRAEAFGISMAEALANGLPAISTSLGTGTDWVNEHGTTGLVVPPKDPAALEAAIEALKEISLWTRLSRGAQEVAQLRYSPVAHCDVLFRQYEAAAK